MGRASNRGSVHHPCTPAVKRKPYSFGLVVEIKLEGVLSIFDNNHLPDIPSIFRPLHPKGKDEQITLLEDMKFQMVFIPYPFCRMRNDALRECMGIEPNIWDEGRES